MLGGLRFVGRSGKPVTMEPLLVVEDACDVRDAIVVRKAQHGRSMKNRSLTLLFALGLSAACGSPNCRARLHWQGQAETFRVYGCAARDCVARRLLGTVAAADACRGDDCEATVVATAEEPWFAVAAVQSGGEALSAPLPGCNRR